MVGFLFDSELGQHGRLSILNLGSMVGFLFTSWAAWSAFYSAWSALHSELGQHGRLSSWAAFGFLFSVGQHGRLSILKLGSMVGFLF